MTAKLIIKNFGPIKDLEIEIKKFNILIGPQASGKSTIAKVLCIIHWDNISDTIEIRTIEDMMNMLAHYRIERYYSVDTYWFFEDDELYFKLERGLVFIESKKEKPKTGSYYFPAERIALPMISESLFELTYEQSALPPFFLRFGRDFTIARKNQKVFNLPLLEVEFEYKENKNVVILRNNQSLFLEETSSAIQANLPLLITLQYPIRDASMFVIEELELHNFPSLQKKLLYYVIKRMNHVKFSNTYVILSTHSPYLLSTANNLLFAAKAAAANTATKDDIDKVIPKASWIDLHDFSAFYIQKDENPVSIIDPQTGMIYENKLDEISEDLAQEFDSIMNLYSPILTS